MASEKAPAYQRYPNDYLTDPKVVSMSLEEEGAYNRLMDFCWKEGSLPDDVVELASMCKHVSVKRMEKIWARVGRCFKPHPSEPGRLIHKRLEEERERQRQWRERQARHGRKGAEKRWGGHGQPMQTPIGSDSSSSSSASAIEASTSSLRAYLGEHQAAVDRMSASADHGVTWEAGIFALYGPTGTDTEVWKNRETGESTSPTARPGILAVAIDRYAAEGKTYTGILFRRFLERARDERSGSGNTRTVEREAQRATGTDDQSSRRRKPLGTEE